METVLKFEKVILVKELNERFRQVGEVFEIANVLDNSFVLRNAKTKVAVGVVSFEDFERCFTKEGKLSGWTPWTGFTGLDGRTDAFYRTNGKRVEVKFVTDKVRATSCCHVLDEFNLFFGIQIAYFRAENKALAKKVKEYKEKLLEASNEIEQNNQAMKHMIDSLKA